MTFNSKMDVTKLLDSGQEFSSLTKDTMTRIIKLFGPLTNGLNISDANAQVGPDQTIGQYLTFIDTLQKDNLQMYLFNTINKTAKVLDITQKSEFDLNIQLEEVKQNYKDEKIDWEVTKEEVDKLKEENGRLEQQKEQLKGRLGDMAGRLTNYAELEETVTKLTQALDDAKHGQDTTKIASLERQIAQARKEANKLLADIEIELLADISFHFNVFSLEITDLT